MKDKRVEELESEEMWDFDKAERLAPVKDSRAVVSVGFRQSEFQTVAAEAERRGMKVSTFIKTAAIERASPAVSGVHISLGGVGGGTFAASTKFSSVTRAVSPAKQHTVEEQTVA